MFVDVKTLYCVAVVVAVGSRLLTVRRALEACRRVLTALLAFEVYAKFVADKVRAFDGYTIAVGIDDGEMSIGEEASIETLLNAEVAMRSVAIVVGVNIDTCAGDVVVVVVVIVVVIGCVLCVA